MEFVISYDMRAPAFGAPIKDLYAAALDQCSWADDLGFDVPDRGQIAREFGRVATLLLGWVC